MGNKNRNRDNQSTGAEQSAEDSSRYESLIGSNLFPALVKVAGFEVQLGQAVEGAFKNSGLTLQEWNALDQGARDTAIGAVIDPEPTSEGEGDKAAAEEPTSGEGAGEPPAIADGEGTGTALTDDTVNDAIELPEDAAQPAKVDSHTAWVRGVFEDYLSVMGAGKYPDPVAGARAQRNLLQVVNVLEGLEDAASTPAYAAAVQFFRDNQEDATSDRSLPRFLSEEDATKLLTVAAGCR